eukprot:3475268-Pyramimonas_sp.AAC.1
MIVSCGPIFTSTARLALAVSWTNSKQAYLGKVQLANGRAGLLVFGQPVRVEDGIFEGLRDQKWSQITKISTRVETRTDKHSLTAISGVFPE